MGSMGSDRDAHSLTRYLPRFPRTRVLVVGDLMVDHYIWGKVTRISPEAPVPVVDMTRESRGWGGAANVLKNVLSLGGQGEICGVVGSDAQGAWLLTELKESGVDTDGIAVEEERPTTTKTRIIAHSQQVVRYDRERREPVSSRSLDQIFPFLLRKLREVECLVISDYAKGVITDEFSQVVMEEARRAGVKIVVDPKVSHFDYFQGATVVTPNNLEASQVARYDITDEASLLKVGETLRERVRCEALLITRGEEGMTLFEKGGEVTHIPTVAQKVFDVTGAGDTVVATLAISLAAGASMKEAAILANHAAGIVVGLVGTATVSHEELRRTLAT